MPVGLTWQWFGLYRGVGLDTIGYSCNVCWMCCAMDATMKIGWGGGCRVLTIRPGNQQVFQSILHYARRWVLRRPGYCSKSSDSHGLPRPKQNKLTRKTSPSENICTVVVCTLYTYIYIIICPQLTCTTDSFLNPSRKRARATCPLYSSSKSLSMCSLQSERQYILEFGNMQIVWDFAVCPWARLASLVVWYYLTSCMRRGFRLASLLPFLTR